jgi:hypothetical protein
MGKIDLAKLLYYIERLAKITEIRTLWSGSESIIGIFDQIDELWHVMLKLFDEDPERAKAILFGGRRAVNIKFISQKERAQTEGAATRLGADKDGGAWSQRAPKLGIRREIQVIVENMIAIYYTIWQSAYKSNNDEVSSESIHRLIHILSSISQRADIERQVVKILGLLRSITSRIISENKKPLNRSIYAASHHWYIDIIFNKLGQREMTFNLEYLPIFDDYFFSIIRSIIKESANDIFNALVSFVNDGTIKPLYTTSLSSLYIRLALRRNRMDADFRRRCEEFDKQRDLIGSMELYNYLSGELSALKAKMLADYSQSNEFASEFTEIEENLLLQYEFNNLQSIMFAAGAYCLFCRKYDYIRYMWQYNNPPDRDARYIGEDIIISDLKSIIVQYFAFGYLNHKYRFWEDHHGEAEYLKKYFILIILRSIINMRIDSVKDITGLIDDIFKIIKNPSIIKYEIMDYGKVAKLLENDKGLFDALGYNFEFIQDKIKGILIPFFDLLEKGAAKALEGQEITANLDKNEIKEFKNKVVESFYDNIVFSKL